MKKILAVGIISLLILSGYMNCHYGRHGIIFDIKNDTLIIRDSSGNSWEYKTDKEYQIGDRITMWMNNHNTTKIEDDEILKIYKRI